MQVVTELVQRAGLTAYIQAVAAVIGIVVALTTRAVSCLPELPRDALVARLRRDGPGAGRRRLDAQPPEETRVIEIECQRLKGLMDVK